MGEPRGPAPGEAMDPLDRFSDGEIRRYARHLVLPDFGPEGQAALREARVLVIGAGGLGSPAAMYLAAAGVGTLGLVDDDVVDPSNLQRQLLHGEADVGRSKVDSARDRIAQVNPHVRVETHPVRLDSGNALGILEPYDVVVDGSDNFPTRYLVNDACVLLGRPLVFGAVLQWEGQAAVFATPGGPCYRCLFREPPPPGAVPTCQEGGVLGVLPGIIGSVQALEAIKLLLMKAGLGRAPGPGAGRGLDTGFETLAGRFLVFEARTLRFRELELGRDPACPVCGDAPTLSSLIDYEVFCGVKAPSASGPLGTGEPGGGGAGGGAEPQVPQVEPGALARRLQMGEGGEGAGGGPQGPLLLDVREPYELALANLNDLGAVHIPMAEVARRVHELPRDREVVVLCHSGARSGVVARTLLDLGFPRVANLRGGITAWSREVDPGVPTY